MHRERIARLLMACVVGLVLTLGGMVGRAAAEGNGLQVMWYDANYGVGAHYYKSDDPITVLDAVYGEVSQTGDLETGLVLAAECTDSRYAAGSGVAFRTGLTVGDLSNIAILADFETRGNGVFNLFFDLNKDGRYFRFDGNKYIDTGEDNYALCQSYPSHGSKAFVIDGSTSFNIMNKGGVHTLAEIASGSAGIPVDTPVAFWVGVWDTKSDDGPLSLTLRDIRVNPLDIVVDDDLSSTGVGEIVERNGHSYVYGFDAFGSIQSAINAAPGGAVVQVMAGTYDEEVKIDKSITLAGEGANSTIITPSAPVNTIVTVSGQDVKAKITGFTIKGPCQVKASDSFLAGIFVRDGAHCEIIDNKILDIRDGEVLSGAQRGIAIFVGRQSYGTTGTAVIEGNIIEGYQKGGIVVDNAGSHAIVRDNTVTGHGQTPVTAQNGIQISRGAEAEVKNNTVAGHWYTGNGWSATGILLYEASDTEVTGNTLNANQVAIDTDNRASFPGVLDNTFASGDLANGLDVNVSTAGWPAPDEVWISAAYQGHTDGAIVGRAIVGYDAFTSITDGISAVAPGGTVHIAAGIYEDSITISKALTILGPNAGINPNESPRNNEAVFRGKVSLDTADGADVVIDGLMFLDDQTGRDHISVYLKGNGDYEIKNCVFERDTGATNDALDSEKGRMIRAIHIGPAACSAVIENNLFTGSNTNIYRNSSWRSAIWSDGVTSEDGVVIRNNVFRTNRTALNLDNKVDNIKVTGNRFVSNGTHVALGGKPVLTGEYDGIHDNKFSLAGTVFNLSGVDSSFRLDATDNEYDVTALDSVDKAKTPESMDLKELFTLESAMYHKGKDGRQGLVRVVEGRVFVTPTSGTIQQALDVADPGDVVEIAEGVYNQTFAVAEGVTVKGQAIGKTIIRPSALLQTGVGHKYDNNMAVTVFVNGAGDDEHPVSVQDMTIDGNNLNGNAVVFWNNSVGSLERVEVKNPRPFDGIQTGQAIAVDAGPDKLTKLHVIDCHISDFNKNGIDAVNGNGTTAGGGSITVNVIGGSITGCGETETNAQNGVLFWERAGGSVGGSVQGTEISNLIYTKPETHASGILVYSVKNGDIAIENVDFAKIDQYVCLAQGTDQSIDLVDCTFEGESAASASDAGLASIEDKIWHLMDDEGLGLITFRPDTLVVTKNTRGIQAAINAASSGDEIIVAAGTYQENVVIHGDKDNLRLTGAGSDKTTIAPTSGRAVALQGYPEGRPISGVRVEGFTLKSVDGVPFIALSSTPDDKPYTKDLVLSDIVVDGGQWGIVLNAVEGATLENVRLLNITSTAGALELTGVSGLRFTGGTLEENAVAVRLQSTSSAPGAGYGRNGDIEINKSRIVNNGVAIENQDTGATIDATNNYWGQPGGPDKGKISGNVTTAPWYTDQSMTTLSNTMVLTVSHTGNGYVKVEPNKAKYVYGEQVKLTAVPDKNWKFSGWSGDVTGSLPEVIIVMDGSKNVTASFLEMGHSTYEFTVTIPSEVVEDREYTGEVALKATTVDETGYDLVRIKVKVVKPEGATVTLKATDSNGVEHDIAAVGYWGPESGFPISADYSATTPVKATFSRLGVYTITLSLVDLSNNHEIASETVTLTVKAQPVTPPSGGTGGGSGTLPPVIAPSVTETVEANTGGTVELEDGSAAVVLPPNAVQEQVTVTLAPVTEVTQPTTGMVMIAGKVFEITAETDDGELITQFSQPITLTFTLTEEELEEADVDLEDLRVFYWDEKAKAWIALPTTIDPETGTITALTDHFTVFAVMAKPDMPALNDIPGHWAESYILRLVSLGVVGGYEDGTYRPEAGITRQEFAKMVVLAAGLEPDAQPELTFADSDEIAEWAKGYVSAAVKAGIITGVGDNRFAPKDPVTRAQAATMIMRSLGGLETSLELTFADAESIPEWAQAAILGAVEKGIIDGFEDNTFRPDLNATRAQAAKMLSRLTVVRFED